MEQVSGDCLQLRRSCRPLAGELKDSFEQYIKGGGGLVTIHAADNAFNSWTAFNEMIALGDGVAATRLQGRTGTTKMTSWSPIPAPVRRDRTGYEFRTK